MVENEMKCRHILNYSILFESYVIVNFNFLEDFRHIFASDIG